MDKERKNYFSQMASQAEKSFTETEQYEAFLNATPQEKMDVLNARKSKVPTADYLPQYEKLLAHIKEGKGLMLLSIGTTGLMSQSAEVMQASVMLYNPSREESGKNISTKVATFVSLVDPDTIDIADISKKNTGYDIFTEGGFDRAVKDGGLGIAEADYRMFCKDNSKAETYNKDNAEDKYNVLSKQEFAQKLSAWFGFAKEKGLEVVAVSPDFARPFLKNVGVQGYSDNVLDIQELVRCHDYKEVVKELHDNNYKGEFISNTGKGYKIEDFAKNLNNIEHLYSSREKCVLVRNVINDILTREKIFSNLKLADLLNGTKDELVFTDKAKVMETGEKETAGIVSYTNDAVSEKAFDSTATDKVSGKTIEEGDISYESVNGQKIEIENLDFYKGQTVTINGQQIPVTELIQKAVGSENSNKEEEVTDINTIIAKSLQEQYAKLLETVEKIASSLFSIENDVKELKSAKEKPITPKRKRKTKAEKEAEMKARAEAKETPAEAKAETVEEKKIPEAKTGEGMTFTEKVKTAQPEKTVEEERETEIER